jgi:hypothetical protein
MIIDWDEQPLGEMTDVALAERLGVHPKSVFTARVSRGIPRFPRPPARDRRQTRRTISISGATYRRLRIFAEQNGRSMAGLVEQLLGTLVADIVDPGPGPVKEKPPGAIASGIWTF